MPERPLHSSRVNFSFNLELKLFDFFQRSKHHSLSSSERAFQAGAACLRHLLCPQIRGPARLMLTCSASGRREQQVAVGCLGPRGWLEEGARGQGDMCSLPQASDITRARGSFCHQKLWVPVTHVFGSTGLQGQFRKILTAFVGHLFVVRPGNKHCRAPSKQRGHS